MTKGWMTKGNFTKWQEENRVLWYVTERQWLPREDLFEEGMIKMKLKMVGVCRRAFQDWKTSRCLCSEAGMLEQRGRKRGLWGLSELGRGQITPASLAFSLIRPAQLVSELHARDSIRKARKRNHRCHCVICFHKAHNWTQFLRSVLE